MRLSRSAAEQGPVEAHLRGFGGERGRLRALRADPEQREIRDVCREFADREIRPIAAEVDEADVETPWEVWYKAAALGLTSFMLPEESAAAAHRLRDRRRPGGALPRLRRHRQPHHLRRLLRRADRGARERGAAAALARADRRRTAAADGARHHRAGRRLRRRLHRDHGDADGRRLRPARPEDVDLERRPRRVLRRLRHGRARLALARHHRLRRREGRPRRHVRRADAEDGPARDREHGDVPRGRRAAGGPAARRRGQGFYGLMRTFDRSRITLGASATGIARAALEYAVEYAKSREQFGKPIAEHQAVAFRLADMATRVDAARLLVHRAARQDRRRRARAHGGGDGQAFASETAMWCTWAAVQTLGGWGYSREYPGREVDARRQARGDRGGHVRHPAPDHLAEPAR